MAAHVLDPTGAQKHLQFVNRREDRKRIAEVALTDAGL
jgi:hypothetical protein